MEAVRKFQTQQKLEPTGIFDTAAFEKLRELQNIPNPRRRRRKKNRGWSRKKKLVIFGGGGVFLLAGTGGAIFLLLRYINSGQGYEEDFQDADIEENEEEREIELTELYPISPKLQKTEPIANADERELESDLSEIETFPSSFPTPNQSDRSETHHEPISPAFTGNSTLSSEVPPREPSSLTPPRFATDIPTGNPHFIPSPLDSIEELIRQLHSPDPDKRKKTIWELAREADSRAVQPLVSLLLESDSQQQSLILEALSQIGTRTLKPMNRALALSLQDDNAQVRKNAIRDLTRVYELIAQLSQLIYYATDDPDPEVQETAKWALGQLSHIRMLPSDRNHE
ncbi:MAG: HEAT repeat domain-containing protein [Cyanobacteria bacterium SBLK]|nr:HEAT repeat domain-containing protein [Cyanobacteria bacterium SBLK]